MRPETTCLRAWSEAYNELGWATFPLRRVGESWVPLANTNGFLDAPVDFNSSLWDRATGIGIAAPQSKLMFIDLDVKHGKNGPEILGYLESGREEVDRSVEAITKSRGAHIVCKAPAGVGAVHMTGKGSDANGWPGIDIIGNGYIVAEPTPGYMWLDGQSPWDSCIPEAPDWLVDAVLRYTRPSDGMRADRGPERSTRSDRLTTSPDELATFSDALAFVDADCGRDDWIKIGMAINAKSGGSLAGFELWDDWSRGGEDKPARSYDAKTIYRQWVSFDPWHTIQPGTLFAIAEQYGWTQDGSRERVALQAARDSDPEWGEAYEQALEDVTNAMGGGRLEAGRRRRFERMHDLLAEKFEDTPWLVDGLLPADGVFVVGGEPKTSKTWVGLELMLSVASKTRAFGHPDHGTSRDGKPVFCFLAEDSRRALRNRYRALAASKQIDFRPFADKIKFQALAPMDLMNLADLAAVVASVRLEAPEGAAAVYLDPLRDMHGGDENASDQMSKVAKSMRALRSVLGCAVVFVHHTHKSSATTNGRRAGQKLRGSGALHGAVDGGIYLGDLKRPTDDSWENQVQVELKAARSAPDFKLTLTLRDDALGEAVDARWDISRDMGESSTDAEVECVRAVERLRAFPDGPPYSARKLAEEARVSPHTAKKYLTSMESEGRVRRTPKGLWLPDPAFHAGDK